MRVLYFSLFLVLPLVVVNILGSSMRKTCELYQPFVTYNANLDFYVNTVTGLNSFYKFLFYTRLDIVKM